MKHHKLSEVSETLKVIVNYESNGKDLAKDKLEKDKEWYFAQSIAAKLCFYTDSECFIIKHEINIIFKRRKQKHGGGNMNLYLSNFTNPNLGYFGTQCSSQTQPKSSSKLSVERYLIKDKRLNFNSLFDSQLNSHANSNLHRTKSATFS